MPAWPDPVPVPGPGCATGLAFRLLGLCQVVPDDAASHFATSSHPGWMARLVFIPEMSLQTASGFLATTKPPPGRCGEGGGAPTSSWRGKPDEACGKHVQRERAAAARSTTDRACSSIAGALSPPDSHSCYSPRRASIVFAGRSVVLGHPTQRVRRPKTPADRRSLVHPQGRRRGAPETET